MSRRARLMFFAVTAAALAVTLGVGLEVAGGFVILASEFLDQTAVIRTKTKQ